MELRSCNNLHFINALNGGLVIKALNVNRGRPLIKFKALKDIYRTEDENNQSSDDEFTAFPLLTVKVERPTMSESDVSEVSCEDDGASNSDLDDIGTGNMTLKQIKEKCKATKRKRPNFANSRADELCSQIKQEADEDECDLKEPLITWKAKTSKKLKGKTNYLKSKVSVPPQSPTQLPSNQDFTGSTESLPGLVNVKVEVPEPDCSNDEFITGDSSLLHDDQVNSFRDSQSSREVVEIVTEFVSESQESCSDRENITSFTNGSSFIYDDKEDSCGVIPDEAYDTASEGDEENEASNSPTGDLQPSPISQECHYYEEDANANSEPVVVVDSQVDSLGTAPREVTEITPELFLGTETLTSEVERPHLCVLNSVSHNYVDHEYSDHVQSVGACYPDIEKVDFVEAKDGQDSDRPVPESEGEGYDDKPLCADIFQVTLPNCDHRSDVSDSLPNPSEQVIPCNVESTQRVQSPKEATYGCFEYIESKAGSEACSLDDGARDDLPSIPETSSLYCSDEEFSLVSNSCFVLSPEDSPTAEEKQSQSSSTCAVLETNYFPQNLSCDAQKELSTSDGDGNCSSNLLPPPPQRLLSTRKAISPDSQEKLCKAMNSFEINEEEHDRPHKKLRFEQQNGKEKVNKAERSGRSTRIRFLVNQRQNNPKPKHEKRNSQTNALPNGPHSSHAAPRFTTGCNSIESCSQSAISFSQRQMQDIECLAMKLTNELKAMKEIAEDRLYSETFPLTSLKYKTNEVRMAIKSASKVEQLANRWLLMMARDCNRFCKIMGLAEKDSDAAETEGTVNKERKKITFADEAGEELCHVKFFEKNLEEFSSGLEHENPEVLN